MIPKNRQEKLLSQFDEGALVIISTNPEQYRNGDVHFPFRPHSDFWYLTGFKEPEAVAVFSKDYYTIFLQEKNLEREIWDGERLGVAKAAQTLNANQAYPTNKLKVQLPQLIKEATTLYYDFKPCALDDEIIQCLDGVKTQSLGEHLHEMRLIKDDSEIALMQKAADISVHAHQLAMQQVKADLFEYEIASIFDAEFRKNNTEHAYTPIVAGGGNGCILHYIKNDQVLNNGDLLLIDAGCEVGGYASDITRTFPVNGKFSKAQRQIYQIVLDAQLAAIACIKPGEIVTKAHQVASQIIQQGLIDLGILQTDGDLSQFYMHGTGHWLGLDVHDVGSYRQGKQHRQYEIGMVTTVEPGIYIRKSDKINPVYWDIGIRIEDDVLITDNGNSVLTKALVKEINDIENLMK
ncbi:Xaa-Pro aminopeptidase (EC 3.4.11.9) [uncultured Gammaproteobacteria bacterium]|jgi:Xaa-Pro aminopeptidase|uniref:aminopeptidase P N-terminal domain-containing protein n=1 Tax=thiotrophic endosymbiont of Bathymodiolus puteoserpentis (Logatchev) TaxID=343240 RepID=UPI0010B1A030|nr:aminopeptidase P N-terminal domain-containing protein [thiotrophic endosymbiont of Bathymodiolus puteoserpentis (Logatchev)]CAC9483950.1 Xaa-Pro aminopeptidase (EC 3.4.11.9) [uncultured Gammaproteobacteria bacterium]CAC9485376.1 Xaa-Pro aminopeptidase (EC 3.4.11.9) [uncultured Gammaproteobacteria bacterium]CAC9574771.1 Xaa-Pro aminopeptidase (EC 3.4.11.9) [uncultured Gammaproteobacteria bacterium]CAC9638647.1 Xaa-Pro aminopeptidase (EC 3.4.11.9) [uncultured Gammaproteobacteria bacterium]CAC